MHVSLTPELARFVEEQVKAGRFSSAAEAVRAGVARLMLDVPSDELDAADLSAIEEGLDHARCGDVRPWAQVRDELRSRYQKE